MKKSDDSVKIARYISEFLETYAPNFLTTSEHTLKSYRNALGLYICFLETESVTPESFSRHCFEREKIEKWIVWLKESRNCSPETCNVRLGSLRVFLEFLSDKDIEYLYLYQEAQKIKRQKCTKKKVSGFTRDAVAAMLAVPDVSTKTGKRDLVFLTLLYATAGRLDEIRSIKIQHLHLEGKKPYVNLIGKRDKIRTAYLLPKVVAYINAYLDAFHDGSPDPEAYLFYSRVGGKYTKLSEPHWQNALKYAQKQRMKVVRKCLLMPMHINFVMRKHLIGLKMELMLYRSVFFWVINSWKQRCDIWISLPKTR